MTIEQLYKDFADQLKNLYGSREANTISDWVFENITGLTRLYRIANKHKLADDATRQQLTVKLQQLLQHKPVQYVLEEAWFYKMRFLVNEHVLIPRPETEELVEWIAADVKLGNEKLNIIDIGTGSGCIAIALKKELPAADITAIDVSEKALSVARQNAVALKANVAFLQMNFLAESEWAHLSAVDILVSNPPYIPENEKSALPKNVIDYEPHSALFVEDGDPFIFYRMIALFAQQHLKKNGRIYVEVHEAYASPVCELFAQYNLMPVIRKDIYGRDRMVCAQW